MAFKKIKRFYKYSTTFGFSNLHYLLKAYMAKRNSDVFQDDYFNTAFHTIETIKLLNKINFSSIISFKSLLNNKILLFYYFTFLYATIRFFKPKIIVETGAGAGVSSTFILKAIEDNNFGVLYSIDFPQAKYYSDKKKLIDDSFWVPNGKETGWAIPENLKKNWNIIIGKTKDKLPILLSDLEEIDFFFHDSEHTYENMFWEYETAWPYIAKGGILTSHDVNWNNAFLDFSKKVNRKPIFTVDGDVGFLSK